MNHQTTHEELLLKQVADSLREYLKWSYNASITTFNFRDRETTIIVNVNFRGRNVTISKEVTAENMKLKYFADLLATALVRKFETAIGGMGSRA